VNKLQEMGLDSIPQSARSQTKIKLPQAKRRSLPVNPTSKFKFSLSCQPTTATGKSTKPVKPAVKSGPRKQNLLTPANLNIKPSPRHSLNEIQDFNFKLITAYTNSNYTTFSGYQYTELTDGMADFRAFLQPLRDTWENRAGTEWSFDIERATKNGGRRYCVTSKLAKGPTVWREADEGFFACVDCVGIGRPCFTGRGKRRAIIDCRCIRWIGRGPFLRGRGCGFGLTRGMSGMERVVWPVVCFARSSVVGFDASSGTGPELGSGLRRDSWVCGTQLLFVQVDHGHAGDGADSETQECAKELEPA